jgi:hypothetical protein
VATFGLKKNAQGITDPLIIVDEQNFHLSDFTEHIHSAPLILDYGYGLFITDFHATFAANAIQGFLFLLEQS